MENSKLDNARKLRDIYFFDPKDGEYKETMKKARKKLEVHMEAAMSCKMVTRKRVRKSQESAASETIDSNKKTKHACIVESHESARKRLESTLPRNYEALIVEKGLNSISHFNLVHKSIPITQAMKIPDAKASVDKECEKLEKFRRGT